MPYPFNPFAESKLTPQDALAYLARIQLDAAVLEEGPSLSLLSRVMLSQLTHVPKDTSPLHVVDWSAPDDTDIILGSNFPGMPIGNDSLATIVNQNRGAFCFSINAVFASLLRTLGFRISETVSRSYKNLGENPETHAEGYKWGTLTHELLIADWEGSDGRYIVDGAWGPWAAPTPIKLSEDETVIMGLNSYEAFKLKHEFLPLTEGQPQPIDQIKGYSLYRYITPVGKKISLPIPADQGGFWSPFYHMVPLSVPVLDHALYHHFSATHELASFTAFWLVTGICDPSDGKRRSMMFANKEGDTKRMAKVYTTGGEDGQGSEEGRDVEWVPMKVGPMREWLKKTWNYQF